MPAYLFLWNPTTDPDSFSSFARICADAVGGRPYKTRWICASTKPKKDDVSVMQRTGPKNNGVFARGVVTKGTYDDDGTRVVQLSLDDFLPVGQEPPRSESTGVAKYEARWMPMASGNMIPGQLYQAILDLWQQRVGIVGSRQKPTSPLQKNSLGLRESCAAGWSCIARGRRIFATRSSLTRCAARGTSPAKYPAADSTLHAPMAKRGKVTLRFTTFARSRNLMSPARRGWRISPSSARTATR